MINKVVFSFIPTWLKININKREKNAHIMLIPYIACSTVNDNVITIENEKFFIYSIYMSGYYFFLKLFIKGSSGFLTNLSTVLLVVHPPNIPSVAFLKAWLGLFGYL